MMFYFGPGPSQSGGGLRPAEGKLSPAEGHPRPRGDGRRSRALRVRQTGAEEPALGWRWWRPERLKTVGGQRVGIPRGVWLGFLR